MSGMSAFSTTQSEIDSLTGRLYGHGMSAPFPRAFSPPSPPDILLNVINGGSATQDRKPVSDVYIAQNYRD